MAISRGVKTPVDFLLTVLDSVSCVCVTLSVVSLFCSDPDNRPYHQNVLAAMRQQKRGLFV
jgi:hypothetical protein